MTQRRAEQLVFRRCRFREPVRIADFSDGPELVFVECFFERGVQARDAVLEHSLTFAHCDFGPIGGDDDIADVALDLENARIAGDLTVFDCGLGGRLFARRLRIEGSVRLCGVSIAPSLDAIPEPIRYDEIGGWHEPPPAGERPNRFEGVAAVTLDHAEIGTNLELAVAGREARRTSGALEAFAAEDWTSVESAQATLIAGPLSCVLAEVRGNVVLVGTIVLGEARFDGIRVRGGCHLSYYTNLTQFRTLHGGCSFMNAEIDGACRLSMAQIDGRMTWYGATVGGYIDLLGMSVAQDLDFNFSTIRGFLHAFRQDADRAFGRRHSLYVGGELLLSGADIRAVELRGAYVQKAINATSSKFGRLSLTWGAEPLDEGAVNMWPKPCDAGRVTLSAITVDETLDVSGIRVRGVEQPHDTAQPGFVLQSSRIGTTVRFFTANIAARLVDRWEGVPPWPRSSEHGNELSEPLDSMFRASIVGELDLRANVIDGHLDLRNVEVHGPIKLNDTSVRLDLEVGWKSEGAKAGGALVTACGYFDAEKLQCDGDVDMTGLLVSPDLWREAHLTAEEQLRRGTFVAREAKVRGQLLFLPSQDVRRLLGPPDMQTPEHEAPAERKQRRPWYAFVGGRAVHGPVLDLTALHAGHLVISGQNVSEGHAPVASHSRPASRAGRAHDEDQGVGISLERAVISRLGVVEPTYDYIDLSNVEVSRWVFGDKDEPAPEDFVRILQHMKPFDRRTWVAVETMFRNEAKEDEANYIYRMMRLEARDRLGHGGARAGRRRSTERGRVRRGLGRGWWHLRDRVIAWTTSYGTQVYRLMSVWLVLFVLSLWVFSDPRNVAASPSLLEVAERPAVLEPAVAAASAGFESPEAALAAFGDEAARWGFWDSLGLTLRYQVPIIPLAIHERWEAGRRPLLPGFTVEHYAMLVQIFSWTALPVLLIYLATGVVRGRR